MRKKDISDAIGNINDRYIEEAADFQRKKKRTGKSSILLPRLHLYLYLYYLFRHW
jgi:hypothetical protein